MSRRRIAAITLVAIGVALLAAVVAIGVRDTTSPAIQRVHVAVPGLTRTYRILQVTDLHGMEFGPRQAKIAALVSGKSFDAVVLTGDLQFTAGRDTTPALDLVRALRSTTRLMLFVPGNHDDANLAPALGHLGVSDLSGGEPVRLKGLLFATLARAVAATAPAGTAVVIAADHEPPDTATLLELGRRAGAPTLVLAGHMHGGQIRLPLLGALIAPPSPQDMSGWTLFPELRGIRVQGVFGFGRATEYIAPGLGSRPPSKLPEWLHFRWGTRAEITELVLEPAR